MACFSALCVANSATCAARRANTNAASHLTNAPPTSALGELAWPLEPTSSRKSKDEEVKFVDLRFTDFRGKEQHVQVPHHQFVAEKFTEGHAFDGSSIAGWKAVKPPTCC